MTNNQLIIRPHAKFSQWVDDIIEDRENVDVVLCEVYQEGFLAGADAELDACCEWVTKWKSPSSAGLLRRDRRPKPPSLAEQAFAALSKIENNEATYGDADIISKALHKLQQYEKQEHND